MTTGSRDMSTDMKIEKSERMIKDIATALNDVLNGGANADKPKVCFAVFCFNMMDVEEDGASLVNYASNARREDVIVAVKEWLARQEGRFHEPTMEH